MEGAPRRKQNADPRTVIGVRYSPGSLQTFRRSTPVPSKGTFHLAVLIPNARSLGNPRGCLNARVGQWPPRTTGIGHGLLRGSANKREKRSVVRLFPNARTAESPNSRTPLVVSKGELLGRAALRDDEGGGWQDTYFLKGVRLYGEALRSSLRQDLGELSRAAQSKLAAPVLGGLLARPGFFQPPMS